MWTTRRQFLAAAGTSAVFSWGSAPRFLLRAAEKSAGDDGKILVVIQLSGGNDGLNTIVPYGDPDYYSHRPKLAIAKDQVLKIDDSLGLHPSLRGFDELLQQQQLAIIQGVGYPNPNRSHFESMDIWHTCYRKDKPREEGWLGRYLDLSGPSAGGDVPAMHLGGEKQPLALAAKRTRVPSVQSLQGFRLMEGSAKGIRDQIEAVTRAPRDSENDLLGFVQSSASAALEASRRVEQAQSNYRAMASYPSAPLAEKLQKVAQLIHAGLKTRIYYLTHNGFDTHARQAASHSVLLEQFASSVAAFFTDLEKHATAERVLLMGFSEFGRRVRENASAGTDHGTAGPMFLAGPAVRSGLQGDHPRLDNLQDGDLKHNIDFRSVYSCVLERWLACNSESVLGGSFPPVDALPVRAS